MIWFLWRRAILYAPCVVAVITVISRHTPQQQQQRGRLLAAANVARRALFITALSYYCYGNSSWCRCRYSCVRACVCLSVAAPETFVKRTVCYSASAKTDLRVNGRVLANEECQQWRRPYFFRADEFLELSVK